MQAGQLFAALQGSTAVQTGFLRSLEECELMIEGIARDKLSDLTTNVIRGHLADYTRHQCALFDIPVPGQLLCRRVSIATPAYGKAVISMCQYGRVRRSFSFRRCWFGSDPAYEAGDYYNNYVLEYLQAEALNAASALVQTLKNGRRVVRKKDLKREFPYSKEFLYQFSRAHPDVLARYREDLAQLERRDRRAEVDPVDETAIAAALSAALPAIPVGNEDASEYHKFMIGVISPVLPAPDLPTQGA